MELTNFSFGIKTEGYLNGVSIPVSLLASVSVPSFGALCTNTWKNAGIETPLI